MACVAHEIDAAGAGRAGRGRHAVPVIADRGDGAAVVVVCFSRTPRLGDSFQFDGMTWEIVRTKDLVRGYVAQPVHRTV